MVLLPGCGCCPTTTCIGNPWPDFIEIDVSLDVDECSVTLVNTYERKVSPDYGGLGYNDPYQFKSVSTFTAKTGIGKFSRATFRLNKLMPDSFNSQYGKADYRYTSSDGALQLDASIYWSTAVASSNPFVATGSYISFTISNTVTYERRNTTTTGTTQPTTTSSTSPIRGAIRAAVFDVGCNADFNYGGLPRTWQNYPFATETVNAYQVGVSYSDGYPTAEIYRFRSFLYPKTYCGNANEFFRDTSMGVSSGSFFPAYIESKNVVSYYVNPLSTDSSEYPYIVETFDTETNKTCNGCATSSLIPQFAPGANTHWMCFDSRATIYDLKIGLQDGTVTPFIRIPNLTSFVLNGNTINMNGGPSCYTNLSSFS